MSAGVVDASTARSMPAALQLGTFSSSLSNYTVWSNPMASHSLPVYLHAANMAATKLVRALFFVSQ